MGVVSGPKDAEVTSYTAAETASLTAYLMRMMKRDEVMAACLAVGGR